MPNPFVLGGPQNVAPGGPNEVEVGDPRPPFAWVQGNPARHGALKLAPGITQPTPIQPDLAHEPGAAAGTPPARVRFARGRGWVRNLLHAVTRDVETFPYK
jgi:hypothetical protein